MIDAVASLEVALSEFARAPNPNLLAHQAPRQTAMASLREQVEGLGLRGTMRFLLPLMFGEEDLDHETLECCWAAIETRNNVVHRGQRDVREQSAQKQVRALRQMCGLLQRATVKQARERPD